ncbi:MAG: DNA polymerase III subunit delta' [Demequinaceae bacterium]|nr:DNA polymerase III subunit delta' [Demequinaceae bacterium]
MSVWDQVVGQGDALEPLIAAARSEDAMTHAWLITGPPGSGRSIAARAFGAALQCREAGCGTCHACRTAVAGGHPDVRLVSTEKVTFSVEEVRQLVSHAQSAPSEGRWRVIVVEDADRMTERTSNVLLKAIEEPPPRTVWVLCAPSLHDVATTIRSRCRTLTLRIPDPEVVAWLLIERDGVEPGLARECALAAQSHIGVAQRLASDPAARERREKVLALATGMRGVGDAVLGAGDLTALADEDAKAATEARNAAELVELYVSLGVEAGERLPPALRAQVRQLEEDQKRRATRAKRDVLDRALLDLLSLYRDVAVLQMGAPVGLVNERHREGIADLAARLSLEGTLDRMDAIGVARERLAGNVSPLLAIEAMALALRPVIP